MRLKRGDEAIFARITAAEQYARVSITADNLPTAKQTLFAAMRRLH